jgi:hypothetical protein
MSRETAKTWFADYASRTSFYAAAYMPYESLVLHLEPLDVLKVRLGAAVVNIVSGPAYGKFRELWAKLFKTERYSSELKKSVVETVGSTVYSVATYSALLSASGASLETILKGTPFVVGMSLVSGRPYGIYSDYVRGLFGVKSVLRKEV